MSETAQSPLPSDDPLIVAWKKWCESEEFKSAVNWALATKYEDGRTIQNRERAEHVKGAMWAAFCKGHSHSTLPRQSILSSSEVSRASIHRVLELATQAAKITGLTSDRETVDAFREALEVSSLNNG